MKLKSSDQCMLISYVPTAIIKIIIHSLDRPGTELRGIWVPTKFHCNMSGGS